MLRQGDCLQWEVIYYFSGNILESRKKVRTISLSCRFEIETGVEAEDMLY